MAKQKNEFYPTPSWCVDRLLEKCQLPSGRWLEPAAGSLSIVDAVNSTKKGIEWTTVDIVPRKGVDIVGDFLTVDMGEPLDFDVCITNPPFSLAVPFKNRAINCAIIVVMLLRLNWLGSAKRRDWLTNHPPDVYILPNRPSFVGSGTDMTEYAWFVWGWSQGGHFHHLDVTSKKERQER